MGFTKHSDASLITRDGKRCVEGISALSLGRTCQLPSILHFTYFYTTVAATGTKKLWVTRKA